jgi:hypothetical protein
MKNVMLFFLLLTAKYSVATAQQAKHQIVFQLVTADTMAHKAFMKQLNNIYTVSPESIVKVVVHGPGIDMYTMSKSVVAPQLQKASLNYKSRAFPTLKQDFNLQAQT